MTVRPAPEAATGAPVIAPGATLGVLGSGQLGRMFAIAARQMGYRVHTLSPERESPTGQVADLEVTAPYDDPDALRAFAAGVSVVTFEFENVPVQTARTLEELVPVRPGGAALHAAQHRGREKTLFAGLTFPTVPFVRATSRDELRAGLVQIGLPAVVKTAAFGYDGKGQHRVTRAGDLDGVWAAVDGREVVIEKLVDLQAEISVIAARGVAGDIVEYVPFENRHSRHILDVTTAPAAIPAALAAQAREIARSLLEHLLYVGVICVEFFVTTDGALLVNEIAPRPHNSGHLTIDAAVTSQFEQQVRAICGLPLGAPDLLRPGAAMANLLGDLWQDGEPDWAGACRNPRVKLHLYGKTVPRTGRKMGHLTATADTVTEAQELVVAARDALLA